MVLPVVLSVVLVAESSRAPPACGRPLRVFESVVMGIVASPRSCADLRVEGR
jgi:hypothetical protein